MFPTSCREHRLPWLPLTCSTEAETIGEGGRSADLSVSEEAVTEIEPGNPHQQMEDLCRSSDHDAVLASSKATLVPRNAGIRMKHVLPSPPGQKKHAFATT